MKILLKKRIGITILLAIASFFTCALFVGVNNNLAYADKINTNIQSEDNLGDESFEEAEKDRINSTTAEDGTSKAHDEVSGSGLYTYYVPKVHNLIKRNINGKEFTFKYNLRGFIGETHCINRQANVQYFYDTETKEMVFLAFGEDVEGFGTFSYNNPFHINTIFEDNITYDAGEFKIEYDIADNAEKCYLDPKIDLIGRHTFQCWKNLQFVDIINQEYSNASIAKGKNPINHICKWAFRRTNEKNGCEVRFLKAFSNEQIYTLLQEDQRKRWAGYCPVIFGGIKYKAVD